MVLKAEPGRLSVDEYSGTYFRYFPDSSQYFDNIKAGLFSKCENHDEIM